jgi:DNA ligase-associated metallophosphoesterase
MQTETQVHNKTDVRVSILGESFLLMPERCAYQESTRTLLCSDLHWGKAEVFQQSGIGVSTQVLEDDLQRLSTAIIRSRAERVLVLGDLVHSAQGVTSDLAERVAKWRMDHSEVRFHLIRGNHDRRLVLPPSWSFTESLEELREGNFVFSHDEVASLEPNTFIWSGHIHPLVRLTGRGDSLRLPCFKIDEHRGLLPAFSAFTGGYVVECGGRMTRLFAVTNAKVIEV